MSNFIIDGIDFQNLEAEKYWSFPSSYDKERKKQETHNMIFSGEYLGARKMDGAYYRFIKNMNGEMRLQGRSKSVSGEYLDKIDWVPHLHSFFESLPNGTCLLGEIYFPNNEGSNNVTKIMGCLKDKAIARQQKEEDKVHYYIFDIWAYNGKSFLKTEAEYRFKALKELNINSDYVRPALYLSGSALWDNLTEILQANGEGIVITRANSIPDPGKRKARKTLKIKKELTDTIDCVIIGANMPTIEYGGQYLEEWPYWYDTRTKERLNGLLWKDYYEGRTITPITKAYYHHWAGSLQLGLYDGDKLVQVGSLSGLTEEILENWKDYLGKVVEVTAMMVMETGGLRHPKFVSIREDKNAKDCTIEQLR